MSDDGIDHIHRVSCGRIDDACVGVLCWWITDPRGRNKEQKKRKGKKRGRSFATILCMIGMYFSGSTFQVFHVCQGCHLSHFQDKLINMPWSNSPR